MVGVGLILIGTALVGVSVFLTASETPSSGKMGAASNGSVRYTVQPDQIKGTANNRQSLATLTPTPIVTETVIPSTKTPAAMTPITPTVVPVQKDAPTEAVSIDGEAAQPSPATSEIETNEKPVTNTLTGMLTNTLVITKTGTFTTETDLAKIDETKTVSATAQSGKLALGVLTQVEEEAKYVEPYTSTAQVQPPPSANPSPEAEVALACPTESTAIFDLIPVEGQPMADHPDFLHGDLNLSLRGYTPISETLALMHYNGNTDPNAPRLHGLFEPNRVSQIHALYQINNWIWDSGKCEGTLHGCRGPSIDEFWPVTLAGLLTTPGEPVYIPERGSEIYSGGYIALVLYAETRRITLGYTRRDNVAAGYTVHLENVCVDPNLVALYQAQRNVDGWRTSGFLPALRNNQALGIALSGEIQVAVRDAGSFMDPRSHKDWWK